MFVQGWSGNTIPTDRVWQQSCHTRWTFSQTKTFTSFPAFSVTAISDVLHHLYAEFEAVEVLVHL